MLKLYDYLSSGNGYKVRLLLNLLDIPFARIELGRTPAIQAWLARISAQPRYIPISQG